MTGLRHAAVQNNQNLLVQGLGPMFVTSFTYLPELKDYRDTLLTDKVKLARFIAAMHDSKIRIIGRGLWYISAAHTDADVDHAVQVASEVLAAL